MKLAGIFFTSLICVWTGIAASARLSGRVSAIYSFQNMLLEIRNEIAYLASPSKRIIEKLMKDSRFELYYPLLSAWDGKQNLSVNQFFPPVLNHEDKALIAGFLNGLGSSDVEGQLAHCNLYQVRIENNLREAENRKNSLSRLYLSLGVLAGIAVAIVCL